MRKLGILLLFGLASCAPQIIVVTSTPEPGPTIIPVSDLNLESLLIQVGDLPIGFEGGQISNSIQGLNLETEYFVKQQIGHDALEVGDVSLFVYSNSEIAAAKADSLFPHDSKPIGGVGERAALLEGFIFVGDDFVQNYQLAFLRCNAIALINLIDKDGAYNYALRLDERLKPILCQYN